MHVRDPIPFLELTQNPRTFRMFSRGQVTGACIQISHSTHHADHQISPSATSPYLLDCIRIVIDIFQPEHGLDTGHYTPALTRECRWPCPSSAWK